MYLIYSSSSVMALVVLDVFPEVLSHAIVQTQAESSQVSSDPLKESPPCGTHARRTASGAQCLAMSANRMSGAFNRCIQLNMHHSKRDLCRCQAGLHVLRTEALLRCTASGPLSNMSPSSRFVIAHPLPHASAGRPCSQGRAPATRLPIPRMTCI